MKIMKLLLSLCVLPMTAQAGQFDDLTVGASIAMWDYQQSCSQDFTPYTLEISASYPISTYMDILGNIGVGISDDSAMAGFDSYANPVNGELSINEYVGIYLKPNIDWGNANIYALLGYAHTRMEMSIADQKTKKNHDSLSYGFGGAYSLTESSSITLEWRQQLDKKAYRLDGFTLGYSYKFN